MTDPGSIGSEEAGAKIAPILSLLETCRRLGINAREYLREVLPGLSERDQSEVPALTPTQWLKRRQPAHPNTSKQQLPSLTPTWAS